jgi:hypothetical protein
MGVFFAFSLGFYCCQCSEALDLGRKENGTEVLLWQDALAPRGAWWKARSFPLLFPAASPSRRDCLLPSPPPPTFVLKLPQLAP